MAMRRVARKGDKQWRSGFIARGNLGVDEKRCDCTLLIDSDAGFYAAFNVLQPSLCRFHHNQNRRQHPHHQSPVLP
jgi:hypothetical protein